MNPIHSYALVLALSILSGRPQVPASKSGPFKSIDPVFARKLEAFRRRVDPIEAKAREEKARGNFAAALASFELARIVWESSGLPFKVDYANERQECLFNLGRYRDLVTIYDAKHIKSPAFGIALIREGRSVEGRSFYSDESVLSYFGGGDYRKAMPGTKDDAHLEAGFRLIRAADLFFKADYTGANRDLLIADRLVPRQPIVSYFLVETSIRTHDWNQAARALPAAKKLTGTLGRQISDIAPVIAAHRSPKGR